MKGNFIRINNMLLTKESDHICGNVCIFISIEALMNFGVNVSFLLSFQFGAFCFPLLPYFRWHHMVTHMVLLFCPIWIYVDDTYFRLSSHFFFVICLCVDFAYIYILSWRRFLMECMAFCVILTPLT